MTLSYGLALKFIRIRGAHNPTEDELEYDQEVRPCAWCRLAGEQAAKALDSVLPDLCDGCYIAVDTAIAEAQRA